jgi:hypothetical protein
MCSAALLGAVTSVIIGSISRQDRSKAARASGKLSAVPSARRPRCEAGSTATGPLPLVDVNGRARAHADRSDLDIVGEDQPVFDSSVLVATAGEGGHPSLIPPTGSEKSVSARGPST